jgi:hypothetical protein
MHINVSDFLIYPAVGPVRREFFFFFFFLILKRKLSDKKFLSHTLQVDAV